MLDERCEQPCGVAPRWGEAADGTGDWDELRVLYAQVGNALATCDQHRNACLACIQRARAVDVLN